MQGYGGYGVAQGTAIMSSSKKYRRLQSFIGYDDFPNSEKIFLQGCGVARLRSYKVSNLSIYLDTTELVEKVNEELVMDVVVEEVVDNR